MKLRDILFRNAVVIDFPQAPKADVVRQLAGFLCSLHSIENPDSVITGILDRESEMSTGIGFGIAVPHVRTASVNTIYLAAARCVEGIEFDAIDGRPVKLIFMLIVPRERSGAYQDILQTISGIMLYEHIREELLAAEDSDTFVSILLAGEENYLRKDPVKS